VNGTVDPLTLPFSIVTGPIEEIPCVQRALDAGPVAECAVRLLTSTKADRTATVSHRTRGIHLRRRARISV
jgi:hypothetical protein